MRKLLQILTSITLLTACGNDSSEIYMDCIRQFHTSVQILEKRNDMIYKDFEYYLFFHKVKIIPNYNEVRTAVINKDNLIRTLDSISPLLDSSLLESILAKRNINPDELSSPVKIKEEDILKIKQKIAEYGKAQISLIKNKVRDSALIKSIGEQLSTEKLNEIDVFNSKTVSKLELLACFYKLKADVVITESNIINNLYNQISMGWYNRQVAFVLPTSEELPVGFPYQASIFLANYDTTATISYEIEGKINEFATGFGVYKQRIYEKPGKYEKSGVFIIKSPYSGEIQKIPFKIEYEVLKKN